MTILEVEIATPINTSSRSVIHLLKMMGSIMKEVSKEVFKEVLDFSPPVPISSHWASLMMGIWRT